MKKLILSILTLASIVSCGDKDNKTVEKALESNNTKELKEAKSQVEAKIEALKVQVDSIDARLAKLDTVEKFVLVTAFTAKDTLFKHFLELQANVITDQNIELNAEYSGILTNIYVKEGQRVRTGQLLAKIDDGGLSQQLAQLEIQTELAKTTYERQKRLWDQKIGSEIQFLQAKSNYEAQEKAVTQLKQQIGKTTIKAPFSGTIDEIITDAGSVVAPGAPVFRIINLGNMYLEADVPESYIGSINEGTVAKVDIPVLQEEIETKVTQASNFINPGNRSFRIKIDVPNKEGHIKPNLTAKARINDYTNKSVVQVPVSILSENSEGEQYVYLAKEKDGATVAVRTIVTTGRTQDGKIEILSGIKAGDTVLLEGARSVKDGQKISIQK
ncbi:efflux RND transporter periplasmic adaptor subunit [Neptunitalea lumnitzerae]|uniref:RND transporter n=1 Tax=Neptunitalea lumnitzerae TaxID=2965509 RepID=A0ABQ5MES3_9FLAO|nr:efflux RND transporter periplasmic adaptor subunit [Neptunitalea sp. Y10]GLB47896.1 RND transporter [Neptunitalea sp. Y10]